MAPWLRAKGEALVEPGRERRLNELPKFWQKPQTSPLSTHQMQKVIKCMTNTVADPGTVANKYFGMVTPGKVLGRQHNQASICVDVGMGDLPSKYPHTMYARAYCPVQILPCR